MNTCEEIQPAISRYLDGELPDAEDSSVFAHAASCAECREFLRSSLALRSVLQSEPIPAVPARLDRRILRLRPRGVRTSAAETVRKWWTSRLPLPVPAIAAAMIVLLAVSVLLVRSLTTPTGPAQPGQAEYILTLETVEVRGAPADPGSNGARF